ncbi:hypothetical protein D3C86_1563120 [compost metagenome]
MPNDRFENAGYGWLLNRCNGRLGQDRVGQQRYSDHEACHTDEAENRGRADVRSLLGEAGIDACPFDAEEHENGDEHRIPHL